MTLTLAYTSPVYDTKSLAVLIGILPKFFLVFKELGAQ